jgi:hypothetical protein
MRDSQTSSGTETTSSQWLQGPQTARINDLQRAISSCHRLTVAAEQALSSGSAGAVRVAFTQAEGAFEQAQRCLADVAAEEVPVDVEQELLSSLGLRLDAMWMRLVCVRPREGNHD